MEETRTLDFSKYKHLPSHQVVPLDYQYQIFMATVICFKEDANIICKSLCT